MGINEFKVWTEKKYGNLPEGSCINVTDEDENYYLGAYTFRATSSEVSVPKNICTSVSPLEETLNLIKGKKLLKSIGGENGNKE